jgi:hypothetical protein
MQCISSNCRGGNVILSSMASSAIAFDSGKVTMIIVLTSLLGKKKSGEE